MEILNSVTQAIGNISPEMWALLLGYIGLSGFQQKIKHWFTIEHPGVLVFITTLLSFAAAVIPAALGYISASPTSLGVHTATAFTGMTLAYRYIIQPSSARLNNIKVALAAEKAYKASLGAPMTTVTVGTSADGNTIVSEPQTATTVVSTDDNW